MADFKLIRPCANCPFRTDVPAYLRKGRTVEISHSLANGAEFPCHKTTRLDEQDEEYDETYVALGGEQFCAGALIMLEKMEQPNQIMRVAERVGAYDPSKLDMDAPIVANTIEFMHHHSEEDEEESAEPCSVCSENCLAPAGYMVGGTVVPATFDPEDVIACEDCGQWVCTECSEDGICEFCQETS